MADMTQWKDGLFPAIGSADKARDGAAIVKLGSGLYDAAPYYAWVKELAGATDAIMKSPYNPAPIRKIRQLGMMIAPTITKLPAPVRTELSPLLGGLAVFVKHAQYLINLRLKTAYHLARSPKILVPIGISQAAGTTLAGVQVRNPYLGASGGAVGQFTAPWAITSFRTSNNENAQLQQIRLTQFLIGGHDFVAAMEILFLESLHRGGEGHETVGFLHKSGDGDAHGALLFVISIDGPG